ncbi:MAG: hypothetical protein ACREUR_07185 [Nitrosospira sp.]
MQIKSSVTQILPGLFPLVLLVSPDLPATSLPDPGGYDHCFEESTKGTTSPRAADNAARTCREKFEKMELHGIPLPPDALGKLIIHAGFGYGIFSGSIYNGNSEYTITRITVLLTPAGKTKPAEASADGKEYDIDLTVPPFTKSALSMPILSDNTQEYSWKITKASGYRTR